MYYSDERPFFGIVKPHQVLQFRTGDNFTVRVKCPNCGRIHSHSGGNDGKHLGYRAAGCGGDYWICQLDEDIDTVIPMSHEVWVEQHDRACAAQTNEVTP